MNLKFEDFKKSNLNLKELDSIRFKNFKRFEMQGFPSKKQEHWKYTDLKNIINNNFKDLQIFQDEEISKYDKKSFIKDFKHNKIILLNGRFVESDFSFEDKKKINIKSLKNTFSDKKDFEKIKKYFNDEQNSMISLNHALANDGITLEINDNYSFKEPLVIFTAQFL